MKFSYLYLLFALSTLFFFNSCQKVIDLDLNEGNEKFVIEGFIVKDSTNQYVKISKTLNFDENAAFPTVDNAVVSIIDDLGNSATYSMVEPGLYRAQNYLGVEGRTYTLTVQVDGKTFVSSSTMPAQVHIDSLTLEEFSFGPVSTFFLVANRQDPANIKNYYQFSLYKNGEKAPGINLQDDQFSDGKVILEPLFGLDYESGDTAVLEMNCIDKNVFKYFYTLSVNSGGTGGAVPANPESNFGSDCLGYFSAQTFERRTKIIP